MLRHVALNFLSLDLVRFVQMRERTPAKVTLKLGAGGTAQETGATPGAAPAAPPASAADIPLDERSRVIAALEQAGWVQARAARLLGITPRQIAYRIQTLNIEVKQI